MTKTLDLAGRRFGSLTALRPVGKKGGYIEWECQCECGNLAIVRGSHLKVGNTQSCGCANYRQQGRAPRCFPVGFGIAVTDYQQSAKKRGLAMELSDEQFLALFAGECHYCGSGPSRVIGKNRTASNKVFVYNGIDRKSNGLGYTADNCVSCCTRCNYAKGAMDYDEFVEWIKTVYERVVIETK